MYKPIEYIDYLYQFHIERDYFECHEILEEYWKDNGMERDSVWVLLIQLAVGLYHHRRLNFIGAHKMYKKVHAKMMKNDKQLTNLGIDSKKLSNEIYKLIQHANKQLPYEPIDLPIFDESIVALYKELVSSNDKTHKARTDYAIPFIIHKHKLRDRTEVITERLVAQKRSTHLYKRTQ